jgi:predicted transcriptional regulator
MAAVSQQMIDRVRGHMFSNRAMALTAAQIGEDLDISYSSVNGAINALVEDEVVEILTVEGQRGYEYQWVGESNDALAGLKEKMHAMVDEICDAAHEIGRETAAQDVSEALKEALTTRFAPKERARA